MDVGVRCEFHAPKLTGNGNCSKSAILRAADDGGFRMRNGKHGGPSTVRLRHSGAGGVGTLLFGDLIRAEPDVALNDLSEVDHSLRGNRRDRDDVRLLDGRGGQGGEERQKQDLHSLTIMGA